MSFLKLLPAGAAALGLFTANAALAADLVSYDPVVEAEVAEPGDWYVSLFAGGVLTKLNTNLFVQGLPYSNSVFSIDPGYSLGIAVGTQVFDNTRFEAEFSTGRSDVGDWTFQGNTADIDGSLYTSYLLGNFWYDFDTGSGFTPYIGGGVGVGYATADTPTRLTQGGFGFAYQLGAGVAVDVAENVAIDFGYRFKALADIDFADGSPTSTYPDSDIYSHTIQAGLRLSF